MRPVGLDEFERASNDFDAIVESTPDIDHFCSASDWTLPAYEAWSPRAETWIRRGDAGFAAFVRHRDPRGYAALVSFDTMWGFSCPLAGPAPAALAAAAAKALRADEALWQFAMISGLREGSPLHDALVTNLTPRYRVQPCAPQRAWQASLEGGVDGFLARRSAKFREALRSARRKTGQRGLTIEEGAVDDLDSLFDRIVSVERRSWKGPQHTGLLLVDLLDFYVAMARRLTARGALRVLFARDGDRDAGYILGGVRDQTYRGLQFSYDEDYADLSLGNVLQIEQIERLCAKSMQTYDLGIDMAYKRHWADEPVDTLTLAVIRSL